MRRWCWCSLIFLLLVMVCSGRHHHRHRTQVGCSRCGPGQMAIRPCHSLQNRDTECAPCPAGTYSPHHSYAPHCYLCARCGEGLYVAHACTTSRDTVCDSCHTSKGPQNLDYTVRCLHEGPPFAPHLARRPPPPTADNRTHALSKWSVSRVSVRPVTRGQLVSVLVASAVASCAVFATLAALAFYVFRKVKSRKVHSGQLYSAVETNEPVML